jgi:hypothetical protein
MRLPVMNLLALVLALLAASGSAVDDNFVADAKLDEGKYLITAQIPVNPSAAHTLLACVMALLFHASMHRRSTIQCSFLVCCVTQQVQDRV